MVSLGCDKNRVDSEIMLGSMIKRYDITSNPKDADIIVVNTCGFIESAKQESIDTILEMARYKDTAKCKLLIATGCLIQRYGDELQELIPELDIMLGVNDYRNMDSIISHLFMIFNSYFAFFCISIQIIRIKYIKNTKEVLL